MIPHDMPMSDKEARARHEAMEKRMEELATRAPNNPVAQEMRGMEEKQEKEGKRIERWGDLQPIFSEAREQYVGGKISWEETLSSVIELLELERNGVKL